MTTTQYLHGTTKKAWKAHIGACLTDSEQAAIESAQIHGGDVVLMAVDIDMAGMVIQDRTHEVDRDNNSYPGDTMRDIARLQAEGVDVVTYDDETMTGRTMRCVRLISARAVAACDYYEVEIG